MIVVMIVRDHMAYSHGYGLFDIARAQYIAYDGYTVALDVMHYRREL